MSNRLATAEDVILHKLFWNLLTPSERQIDDAKKAVDVGVHIEPGALLFNLCSFLVLVWLMTRLLFKPVSAFLEQRKQKIAEDLDKAQDARTVHSFAGAAQPSGCRAA